MYCPNCNSEVLTEVKTVSETYPVKGEEITVTAKVRCCKNCGQDIWDEELDGQNLLDAFAIYRQRHGLLQAESVKNMVCRRLLLLKFWDLGIKQLPVMRMEVLRIWRKIILLN